MNADRVASYQDWRDDLLRGVGPVTGLPYVLADLLVDAWINRIQDRRLLRLLCQWLKAGVRDEHGHRVLGTIGTPQGAVVSPLMANVYLHYVFDLWVQQWRKRHARGIIVVVRYADDVVVGFQNPDDAARFRREIAERLQAFGLALHPDKTRLIRFGRFAQEQKRKGPRQTRDL